MHRPCPLPFSDLATALRRGGPAPDASPPEDPAEDGTATIGAPCSTLAALACAGHAQKVTLICDTSGVWVVNQTCDAGDLCDSRPGLDRGSCAPIEPLCAGAAPGELVCDANSSARCGPDLVSLEEVDDCAGQTCSDGICQGNCAAGDTRCHDNSVETCDASGQWEVTTACVNQTCIDSTCQGECVAAANQCVDTHTPRTCDATGTWQAQPLCVGQPCDAGSCQAVTDVAAGTAFTCAVVASGSLYCWGRDNAGQLGSGVAGTHSLTPAAVDLDNVTQVTAGFEYACAITQAGELYCWGANTFGQLGTGDEEGPKAPTQVAIEDVAQVSAGDNHACARTSDGALHCWGMNAQGRLGDDTTMNKSTPSLVDLTDVVKVAAGATSTCAVNQSGKLYCWGEGVMGTLGVGDEDDHDTPTLVDLESVKQVNVGLNAACATTDDNALYCWGYNGGGTVSSDLDSLAFETPQLRREDTVDVDLSAHACATSEDGGLVCWGLNDTGQAGNETAEVCMTAPCNPTPTSVPLGHATTKFATGAGHTCAITTEGRLYCWGSNGVGALGDGTPTSRSTPAPVVW